MEEILRTSLASLEAEKKINLLFLAPFLSELKYAKQRDINRAPTSLNAIVGP